MKIAILDDYQHAVRALSCFKLLEGHEVLILDKSVRDISALAATLQDISIIVLIRERTPITLDLLDKLPALKLISQTGKVSGHLDLAACTQHKVAVAEGTGSSFAPAELTWVLIMNTLRKLPAAIAAMKAGEWQINIGTSVHSKTVGIWGYGRIGKLVAGYARAFGAKVLVWGSEASRNEAVADGYSAASDKAYFFRESDVVSLHLRLTATTRGIVQEQDLLKMKPTAVFINTSRAGLVEEGALLEALQQGRPGFAGLDVYEQEPIYDPMYPLLQLPNVVCTPHLGYVEENSYELYFRSAFENILHFIAGKPVNIANPEVL
ncbi:D-2-hydroxyacid dehydrogenase family protein [Chitinophaga sp. 30R24]|uniref:D-2-hydroxyacid dehydrogenase family protein n=1 Tax=Chitinophaga sp. 30R24 TaxID=3248838 RepID=UPI003B90D2B6